MSRDQDDSLLRNALAKWKFPLLPEEIGKGEPASAILSFLSGDAIEMTRRQIVVVEWLFRLVRHNVKRGRFFELDRVLANGLADCVGYVKVFRALGERYGLTLGIVGVPVDNAGRYVPHYVSLLNMADCSHRFIDAWYGSTNINHRRITALAGGVVRDVTRSELPAVKRLESLPGDCIAAITLYMQGNRLLKAHEYHKAICIYTESISKCPDNSRSFFNRAVAYELGGERGKAADDYARAFSDESGLIHVLANIEVLEKLIKLDEASISDEKQDVYLWYHGYKTGEPVGYEETGRKCGFTPAAVKTIIKEVDAIVGTG
jgi:hypothetical protein